MVINDYNDYVTNHWLLVTRGTQALPLDDALMPLLYLTIFSPFLTVATWRGVDVWSPALNISYEVSRCCGKPIPKTSENILKKEVYDLLVIPVPPLSIRLYRHSELLSDFARSRRPGEEQWRTYTHLTRVSATAFRGTNVVPTSTWILLVDVHGNPHQNIMQSMRSHQNMRVST